MFGSTLGLGTKLGSGVNSNKAELNLYLKSLKKKQKEIRKKSDKAKAVAETEEEDEEEEDSDLASLAREFAKEEIQQSPFLRKRSIESTEGSRKASITTPLPEKDAPFVTSLIKSKPQSSSTSAALANFMKFDHKYASKKQLDNAKDSDIDTDDILSEVKDSGQDPKERASTTPVKSPQSSGLSNRLKLQSQEKNLRLTLPASPGQRGRKLSPDSAKTVSEVSDIPATFDEEDVEEEDIDTFSPVFVIEDLPGVDDLVPAAPIVVDGSMEAAKKDEQDQVVKAKEEKKVEKASKPSPDDAEKDQELSSSSSDTSTTVKDQQQPQETESRRSKRRSSKTSKTSRCFLCSKLCHNHRPPFEVALGGHHRNQMNQSVQAGDGGIRHADQHYLFDPSLDVSAELEKPTRLRKPAKLIKKYSSNGNPVQSAFDQMLKCQLVLTETFLQNQRNLYLEFNHMIQEAFSQRPDKILYARQMAPSSSSEAREVLTVTEIEYESDFEEEQ